MNTSDLLEQLLRAGLSGPRGSSAGGMAGGLGGALGGALGGLLGGGGAAGGAAGGAGLGDLLGGLLGGGQPAQNRSGAGLNTGGLAALGMLAFQAYSAWQRSQQTQAASAAPRTVNLLSGPEVEQHSHAILRALIAAAKADGRIDQQEKQLIHAEIAKLSDEPQLQQWLDDEVRRPLDADEVAQSAANPEIAAEMYLASVLLIGRQEGGERRYLDQLAASLGLDAGLQAELEAHARS